MKLGLWCVPWLALAACSPHVARQRVDVQLSDDGVCRLEAQVVECARVGQWLVEHHAADGVNVVLLQSPSAPDAQRQGLQSGLHAAHVTHVQFGDPATLVLHRPSGIE